MLIQLFERRTLEDPATEMTGSELAEWLGTTVTANTGSSVNVTTAMRVSAVFACVRILTETVASLPLLVYERLPNGGKRRAPDHALYPVLHSMANPLMTAMEARENLMAHILLWGTGYAEIVRDGSGKVREFWPMRPDYCSVEYLADSNEPYLVYTSTTGNSKAIPFTRVWHPRGFGTDKYSGMSVITQAREAIGMGIATEEYGARFYANDSRPGGILRHPGKLTKAAAANLKTSWESAHQGLEYAHRVAILEEGMEWQQVGIPPQDAQYLENRKFQVTEIARMFRVPPHMLADLERATFSNIEHQSIEFVVHTIRPWLVRLEQSIYRDLLTEEERNHYFVEHLVDGLLRGDIQSRYQAYGVARQNGWMSADDIRELENMNPLPEGQGSIYLVPLNMVPADQAGQPQGLGGLREVQPPMNASLTTPSASSGQSPAIEARAAVGNAASRRKLGLAFVGLIEDAIGRVLRRERADVMRQAEKLLRRGDRDGFLLWLEGFYLEHREFYQRNTLPVFMALARQVLDDASLEINKPGAWDDEMERFMAAYGETAAADYAHSNQGQLQQVVREAEDGAEIEALDARFEEWQERTPEKQSHLHTIRAANALTKQVWRQGGIERLVWVTYGENCPYCNALRGRTVGINEWFLLEGSEFQPEGAQVSLRPGRNIGHAPAHQGCNCGIAPA